jgi:hypothetical protein
MICISDFTEKIFYSRLFLSKADKLCQLCFHMCRTIQRCFEDISALIRTVLTAMKQ